MATEAHNRNGHIRGFPNLKSLEIIRGKIEKQVIESLHELPSLEELHICGYHETLPVLVDVFKDLGSRIKHLSLSNTTIHNCDLHNILINAFCLQKLTLNSCDGLKSDVFALLLKKKPNACPALSEVESTTSYIERKRGGTVLC